ncbi:MAG: hypothetical protein HY912_18380 [Desulfomonile tiedjei]|uniref:B3/B4 tRNA-binding domain-containing protein n=1 Tax=Desulfomonile tiedjei TaxID=2358 RepID=A0A9D6Z4Z9_9BACT|nr:hypothetical protein [Desulfomonile tiedjei]
MLKVSEEWKREYPGAHVGIMTMRGVENPPSCPALELEKKQLEDDLRTLFGGRSSLKDLEPIRAYQDYYKRFKKTYHVLHQLESIIFKGKSVPRAAALVEAMFAAELRNMLLTAGHDLDSVKGPLKLDIAQGHEKYVRINGSEQILKTRDMFISDSEGVISSVIYGPDLRTMINPGTTSVIFTVYAVQGVSEHALRQHLNGIEANVKLIAPNCSTETMLVFSAD